MSGSPQRNIQGLAAAACMGRSELEWNWEVEGPLAAPGKLHTVFAAHPCSLCWAGIAGRLWGGQFEAG